MIVSLIDAMALTICRSITSYWYTISWYRPLDDARTGEGFARFSDFQDATLESENIGDLAPDDEYRLIFWALVLKDPPTIPFGDDKLSMVSLYVKGQVSYTNPNGVQFKQPFCFLDAGTNGHFSRCANNASH
jgi:hypothetical protein